MRGISEAFDSVLRISEGENNVRCRGIGSIAGHWEDQRCLETKLWPDLKIQQSADHQV